MISYLRGLVSDWLLGLAIDVAPRSERGRLAAAAQPYLRAGL